MEENQVIGEESIFTNSKGEEMFLVEVLKTKKITSVTFSYLSALRFEKADGWFKKLLGIKKAVQDEKELTINDEKGITFYLNKGIESATIRFWSKDEWDKVNNYDETTMWKQYIMTLINPFQINFHIGNLKNIDWV